MSLRIASRNVRWKLLTDLDNSVSRETFDKMMAEDYFPNPNWRPNGQSPVPTTS